MGVIRLTVHRYCLLCYAIFLFLSNLKKEKGGNHLENLIVIKNGDIDFEDLTKEQQQELMTFLFKCFSKMYEEKAKGVK